MVEMTVSGMILAGSGFSDVVPAFLSEASALRCVCWRMFVILASLD